MVWVSLKAVLMRDLLLGWRGIGDIIASLVFFAIIIALAPLALGPDSNQLLKIAPAMLWIGLLIATLPQMERLFIRDAQEGAIDQLLLTPAPLPLIVLTKAVAAWMLIGLPMTVFAPLLAMMLANVQQGLATIMLSLAIGSFALIMVGMLTASLILGTRRSGVLMAILVLPLAMPVLIFGTAATNAAITQKNPAEPIQLLIGLCLILTAISPPLTAISLRYASE